MVSLLYSLISRDCNRSFTAVKYSLTFAKVVLAADVATVLVSPCSKLTNMHSKVYKTHQIAILALLFQAAAVAVVSCILFDKCA